MNKRSNFSPSPLTVDEVIMSFRCRWGVAYDLQLLVRNNRLYLQIMWGYLEQQSFPMSEETFKEHINEVLEIINRLGQSDFVREWIDRLEARPKIGRALSLELKGDERLEEFLV